MKRSAKSAFTLIELLVVIAIIAILAAILFPVFAQARAKARQATCLSNVKQVSLSLLMYVQDYDETLPLLFAKNTGNDTNGWAYALGFRTYTWQNLVQPYTKNWQLFVCPDSQRTKTDPSKSSDPFANYGIPGQAGMGNLPNWIDPSWYTGASVAWDGLGGFFADSGYPYSPQTGMVSATQAQIAAPATMTLVSEGTESSLWTSYTSSAGYPYPTGVCTYFFNPPYYNSSYPLQGGPVAYHQIVGSGSQSNWCYQWQSTLQSATIVVGLADGHAKAFPLKQYYSSRITSAGQRVFQYLWPKE